jgi:NAD(P)-dependent dehydrogenase (short-subunit alcohol dehydrogenase family)
MAMGDLDGLTALVTGASSGIGEATVRALLDAGSAVAGLDVNAPRAHLGALHVATDVTDDASVRDAVRATVDEFGGIDVLVNDAGIGAVGTVEDNADDEWRRVFDVNVFGVVRTTRTALPHLRKSHAPVIINVASVAATTGLPQRACYSASKGAVLSLTRAMAADLIADRIRVNCVCPGTIDTPWVGRLLAASEDPAQQRAALEARQPVGRLGTAGEVAAAILFLAAPSSSFVTGTALDVDGGLTGLRVPAQGGEGRDGP